MAMLPWKNNSGLLPTVLLIRWMEKQLYNAQDISLDGIPAGNGCLPDLLRLFGIDSIHINNPGNVPLPLRWEGHGANRIVLRSCDGQTDSRGTLHQGALPVHGQGFIDATNEAFLLLNLARIEDATAVMNCGSGADWDYILNALGVSEPTALSPIIRSEKDTVQISNDLQVWNPLPMKRYCSVSLPKPDGSPPWGLCDEDGYRYPVQITEGAFGSEAHYKICKNLLYQHSGLLKWFLILTNMKALILQ
ncbi:MAG: hypothetical protein HRU15_10040 [Planctomycetes bacterium]|nr:hypothetical protein [Planctomycetota bacterium]